MASAAAPAYKDVASKEDADTATLEAEEKRVKKLEDELTVAEARVEAAEARYKLSCKRVAEELAKPLTDEESASAARKVSGDGPGLAEVEARVPSDDIGKAEAGSKGAKNTSARTEREVRKDKWEANKAAEGRVKDKSKKLKEKLRRSQRDKRMFGEKYAEVDEGKPEGAGASPAKVFTPEPRGERNPLFESDEVKAGAKSLGERLASLKDLTNAAEKKVAALKVLTGGRENYFVSQPSDVLTDLEKRSLVDVGLASEIHKHLKMEAAKSAPIPPEEWLAHAQKVSGVERKDDQPFKESEVQYLKWIDRVGLSSAEFELDEAQKKLEELLEHVEATWPGEESAEASKSGDKADSAEHVVDEDYAAQLQDKYDPDRQSKGQKNTSALSEKVASKEKWERDRGVENRDHEKNIQKREAKREGARDAKTAAADVDP